MMASLLTDEQGIGYWLQHDLVWIDKLLETLKMSLQAINAIGINSSKRSHLFWQLPGIDSLMVTWKL